MKRKQLNLTDFSYEIVGQSGRIYNFQPKIVEHYPPVTHFPFNGKCIYMFVKDPDSNTPIFIDIDYRMDWSIQYHEIDRYDLILKHNLSHILLFRDFNTGEEHQIISDILDGVDISNSRKVF